LGESTTKKGREIATEEGPDARIGPTYVAFGRNSQRKQKLKKDRAMNNVSPVSGVTSSKCHLHVWSMEVETKKCTEL
jgi:hypothetical protein